MVIEWPHLCAVFGSSARTPNKSLPLLALFTVSMKHGYPWVRTLVKIMFSLKKLKKKT